MKLYRAGDFLAEPAPPGYEIGLHAFAKLNLGLRVGRRRADGYHDVDSVFQTVDFADSLYGRPEKRGLRLKVVRRGPSRRAGFAVSAGPANLVRRAARLLRERYGVKQGASLVLVKRVPAGGGLGGGSSDGAAAIRLLARLWGLADAWKNGERLAAELGADGAFLWRGGRARARGRGERLRSLPIPHLERVAIVLPRRGVATSRAYAWLDEFRDAKRLTPTKRVHTISALRAAGVRSGIAHGENDLEEVVKRHYPEVDAARQMLIDLGLGSVRMTGSGSAVFGVLPRGRDPLGAVTRLRRSPFDVVMARFTRFGSLWCRSGRAAWKRPGGHLPPSEVPAWHGGRPGRPVGW